MSGNLAMYMPDHRAGVVMLTNSANGQDIWEDVAAITLGEGLPLFPWKDFSDLWESFEGRFDRVGTNTA